MCAGGEGYFSYDPDSNGWCSCCTNAEDAVTEVVETASENCKIYKINDDVLPTYVGCFKDTPNKASKEIDTDDEEESLSLRIIAIGDFDWLHDGSNKSGDLKFWDDGSIESHFGDGQGNWQIVDSTHIIAHFGVLDHKLEFDLKTMAATLIDPERDPASMMQPSNTFGNDLKVKRAKKDYECGEESANYGNYPTK